MYNNENEIKLTIRSDDVGNITSIHVWLADSDAWELNILPDYKDNSAVVHIHRPKE